MKIDEVLVLILLTPVTLSWRNGAEQESCYDHGIIHTRNGSPILPQYCTGWCGYVLNLEAEVNESNLTQAIKDGDEIASFKCKSVYLCKLKPRLAERV